MIDIPLHFHQKRLSASLKPTGATKAHPLIDKVYKRTNLETPWKKMRANHGSGGVDARTLEEFSGELDTILYRLHGELQQDVYQLPPVRQVQICDALADTLVSERQNRPSG